MIFEESGVAKYQQHAVAERAIWAVQSTERTLVHVCQEHHRVKLPATHTVRIYTIRYAAQLTDPREQPKTAELLRMQIATMRQSRPYDDRRDTVIYLELVVRSNMLLVGTTSGVEHSRSNRTNYSGGRVNSNHSQIDRDRIHPGTILRPVRSRVTILRIHSWLQYSPRRMSSESGSKEQSCPKNPMTSADATKIRSDRKQRECRWKRDLDVWTNCCQEKWQAIGHRHSQIRRDQNGGPRLSRWMPKLEKFETC